MHLMKLKISVAQSMSVMMKITRNNTMMPMMPPAGAWSSCWLNCARLGVGQAVDATRHLVAGHAHGLQLLLDALVVEHLQQLLAIEVVLLLLHDFRSTDHRCLGERNLGEGEQVQRCQDGSDTADACCCSHGNDLCVKPGY